MQVAVAKGTMDGWMASMPLLSIALGVSALTCGNGGFFPVDRIASSGGRSCCLSVVNVSRQ
jgi:hypothetical protein